MYKLCTATGAALLLAASASFSADSNDNTEGLYVGAGYGDFSVEIDHLDNIADAAADFDESDSVLKYFVGWRFNKFVGAQVDYYDLGKMTGTLKGQSVSSKTKGYTLSAMGTLPLGPVELFARAGWILYDVDVTRGNTKVIDQSSDCAVYSAGVGITVLEHLNLNLEYEVIDISQYDKSDAIWLNAAWRF
jgi:Outer membrane protein beta-barrel domain